MDGLGVKRPTVAPRATEYVDHMVALVADLIDRGVAYETADGVYLSVDRVEGYGLLARQSLDSLRAGARVEMAEEKRSPLDFVLWKKAKPGEPTWPSPGGDGRPGWHTECVVMSLDLLGEGFDLHGGGIDLAFPHHENERAQAVATDRAFARHWVHNGFVIMAGEKMSKSLGNFTSLTDLLERTDGRAYRLLLLRSHYRSPVEVTPDTVADAVEALVGLDALVRRFDLSDLAADVADGDTAPGDGPLTAAKALALGAIPTRSAPSWPPWTPTWPPRRPWVRSSNWPAGPTSPPMAGTRLRAAGWLSPSSSWPPPWASPSMAAARPWTRPPRPWWPSATRPGRPGISPGPTPSGSNWRPRAGSSRTAPTEAGSTAESAFSAGRLEIPPPVGYR